MLLGARLVSALAHRLVTRYLAVLLFSSGVKEVHVSLVKVLQYDRKNGSSVLFSPYLLRIGLE
jgi:hypothetical protein